MMVWLERVYSWYRKYGTSLGQKFSRRLVQLPPDAHNGGFRDFS